MLENSGEIFDKLYYDGYDVSKFVEITMNGEYNKNNSKVRVEFKCKPEDEGKEYKIRHLLSNGEIQEETQVVKNGIIYIWVDEFSPFMIETNDKEDTVKNNNQENNVKNNSQENAQHILDDEPKTGTINIKFVNGILLSISIIGFIVCKNRIK